MARATERLPSRPFADWLNERIARWEARLGGEAALKKVCDEIGWTDDAGMRRLYRYRRMLSESTRGKSKQRGVRGVTFVTITDSFARQPVEEALHHAGVRLGELYPYEALLDEFQMEYGVPRDQATRLADSWIEATWQTVWAKVGLFVSEEDRPRLYCRECKVTTRVYMGACESCGNPCSAQIVAAVTAATLKPKPGPMRKEDLAQARWLREQFQMPYQQIAVVMAVYHGVARQEASWRSLLRAQGVAPKPHGTPFEAAA